MKSSVSAAAALSILVAVASPAAAQKVADSICPRANAAISALVALKDQTDPVKNADVLLPVVNAYKSCRQLALADGAIEPAAHYDEVRASQYLISLGRQYYAMQKYDEAHAAWTEARQVSQDIVDWLPTSRHNTGMSHSQYHDAAVDIVKAADLELARLAPATKPSP
ncbi:MAG TPA: hypothetical protein VKJ77_18865 [Caballeronia sp.]|jgi:hypothetical protein|nr:hypothetical protein [Caballeronia sp.]